MPRIDLARHNQPRIGEFKDLVTICTTTERPDDFVSTIIERPKVFQCHARIRAIRQSQILDYRAVMGDQDTPTVEVTIRFAPDVKIDLNHWVYLETGFAKMWMRVRGVEDLGVVHRFLVLSCSVDIIDDRRSDLATQQQRPGGWQSPDMD